MILQPGTTYALTFTTAFASLNGIYTATVISTFDDLVASGVDFMAGLYTPAGLTQDDFVADYPSLKGSQVYLCQVTTNPDVVYYIPETIISGTPDPTVKKYLRIILMADLGIHESVDPVVPLKTLVQDQVTALIGTTDSVKLGANDLKPVYMTDAQYRTYCDTLKQATSDLTPFTRKIAQLESDLQTARSLNATLSASYLALLKGSPS